MPWLTGPRFQVESELPSKAAREAIRTSTVSLLSQDADSESCVSITIGMALFVSRTAWRNFAFVPSPVFRGRLRDTERGSQLSGRFTIPFFSLATAIFSVCFAALIGYAIAIDLPIEPDQQVVMISAWLLFCAPALLFARWLLRLPWTFAERDQAFVERHLRRVLETPRGH